MGNEVSILYVGGRDKRVSQRGNKPDMRRYGSDDLGRRDKQRAYPSVCISSTKIFPCGSDEENKRNKLREALPGVSEAEEDILGEAFLGERIFCEFSRGR